MDETEINYLLEAKLWLYQDRVLLLSRSILAIPVHASGVIARRRFEHLSPFEHRLMGPAGLSWLPYLAVI